MKVDTKKPQPSEFRQDLLRGMRWGAILLIAMLLTIAGYRVLSSTPATASESKESEELTPIVEVAPVADSTIKVGDAVLKGPDTPSAPEPVKPRKTVKAAVQAPPPAPVRLQAPNFAPPPAAAPKAKASASSNAFIAEPAPVVVEVPAPVVELPTPHTAEIAPPPEDKSKQGNRATRAVRSVGRLFRLGRKDPEAKQAESK